MSLCCHCEWLGVRKGESLSEISTVVTTYVFKEGKRPRQSRDFVLGTVTDIAHVRITGAANMATDTISFKLAPVDVPEPASMALMGLAALGLMAGRRHPA